MTYDKNNGIKRPVYDATKYRNKSTDNDLRWKIAQLEIVIDELLDVIRPFAEAKPMDSDAGANPHFAKAREVYSKRRVANR